MGGGLIIFFFLLFVEAYLQFTHLSAILFKNNRKGPLSLSLVNIELSDHFALFRRTLEKKTRR